MKEYDAGKGDATRRIERASALALFLDFDGTLSPIMPRPEDAYLPARTRHILKKISRSLPVCIITGRPLRIIRKKVSLPRLLYGASHGLEWNMRSISAAQRVPRSTVRALMEVRADVQCLCLQYPQLINEPKPFAVTFHYHLLTTSNARLFVYDLKALLRKIRKRGDLRVFHDKKTIDIVPARTATKGTAVSFAMRYLARKTGKRFLPVYIGDSSADEDAFRALKRGITIRVGKTRSSAAHYYFKNRRGVDSFLQWLAAHCKKPKY